MLLHGVRLQLILHCACCVGKLLQCWCGGDDASTQFLCDQQPVTTWDIFIYPHNDTYSWDGGTALGSVSERAGTYSQVSVRINSKSSLFWWAGRVASLAR